MRQETSSTILSSVWLEWEDEQGRHLAAPDLIVPDLRIAVECKRTYTPEADAQLALLYEPLLSFLWPGQWRLIAASQHWAGDEKPLIGSFLDAAPGLNYYLRSC